MSGLPVQRISSLWISSPLTGAPVVGSTQNMRFVLYQRSIPACFTTSGVAPMGSFLGTLTFVHGMVCSK